jgi:hypothetical protein
MFRVGVEAFVAALRSEPAIEQVGGTESHTARGVPSCGKAEQLYYVLFCPPAQLDLRPPNYAIDNAVNVRDVASIAIVIGSSGR